MPVSIGSLTREWSSAKEMISQSLTRKYCSFVAYRVTCRDVFVSVDFLVCFKGGGCQLYFIPVNQLHK